MKYLTTFSTHLLISLLCILSTYTYGQGEEVPSFEGTINYEVKFSGAMAENLRVNEANNELLIHMKDGDYIINLKGGRYPKTFMYVNKKDMEYSIDVSEKKAFVYSSHTDLNRETHKEKPPIAQYSGKSAEVNGVMCDIYRMKKGDDFFTFFVTDQYRVNIDFFEGKKRAKPLFLVEGLEGKIPLKIIRKTPNLTVITQVKKFTPRSFSTEQFEVPVDFEVSKRDYRP